MISETSFENTAQETSTEICHTVGSLELHNDLTHYYNVPGVSTVPADWLLSDSLLPDSQQTKTVTSGMFWALKHPHPK